jgi:hypothetical protein
MSQIVVWGTCTTDQYWQLCKQKIDENSKPQEKFQAFVEITNQVFETAGLFAVLTQLAQDPKFKTDGSTTTILPKYLQSAWIDKAHLVINKSKELSNAVIKTMPLEEQSQLRSRCHHPDSYIDNKIFHILSRILLSEKFIDSAKPGHPFYSLNQKMWELSDFNHGQTCPCYPKEKP